MDRKEFFPPHTIIPPQFFPPPNVVFSPNFPPPSFHIPPPPIFPGPPVETYQISDAPSVETIITHRRSETATQETQCDTSRIKVHEFSQRIQEFHNSLNKLKSLLEDYKSRQDDSNATTPDLRAKIIAEQEHVSKLKESMNIYFENIQVLKKKISQRRRKRKKKVIRPPGINPRQIAADHMHHLLRIATDVEQDEKLKTDADNILSDVLRKKNEANQCLRLLNSLERLHTARCNSIGTNSKNLGFNAVIEKLKTLWEARLQEYAVEENGFRVMIEELAMDRKKERNENTDKIFEEWCKSIFGVSDFRAFSYFANVDDFIRIRHAWDKYVVEDSEVSSRIPPGWVLPENRRDLGAWEKFICK